MLVEVDGIKVDLLVGADPEIFVTTGGKPVSAHGLVPGTKDLPFAVNKGAIQVDGMALEFNINPASSCKEFVGNIQEVLGQLVARIPNSMELAYIATAEFGASYIKAQPFAAQELGCSSDFNAYTGKENPKPNAEAPFRTAAGHVHLGWSSNMDIKSVDFLNICNEYVKVLDLMLGVPSVLKDPDVKRRSLYGKAGAYRPKEYGLEYRVLSNFWLKSKQDMEWVYQQSVEGLRKFLKGFRVDDSRVEEVINSSDTSGARALMKEYGVNG